VKEQFRIDTQPLADPANVVRGDRYRITVLETGLVRLEWSEDGVFEDRASQTVLHRAFAPVDFTVRRGSAVMNSSISSAALAYW